MARDRYWLLVASVPLILCAAVRGETPPAAGPAAEAPLPKPQIPDLFGHQPAPEKNADTPPVAESEREVKRPQATAKSSAATAVTNENKRIDRQARDAAGWRFWDTVPLLSVLALIAVIVLILKRFLPARGLLNHGGLMEVIARMPLSGKQNLVLVKLGQRLLLLGVAPDRINTLCIVDDPQQTAELLGELASRRSGSMTRAFTKTFDNEAGRYFDSEQEQDATVAAGGHVRGLLDKVKEHLVVPVAGRSPGKPGG